MLMALVNRKSAIGSERLDIAPSYDHLAALEAESIHIMREVVAEFERPVLLFSGGKDSIVMLRIAEKAFLPGQDSLPADARRHRPTISPRSWTTAIGASPKSVHGSSSPRSKTRSTGRAVPLGTRAAAGC